MADTVMHIFTTDWRTFQIFFLWCTTRMCSLKNQSTRVRRISSSFKAVSGIAISTRSHFPVSNSVDTWINNRMKKRWSYRIQETLIENPSVNVPPKGTRQVSHLVVCKGERAHGNCTETRESFCALLDIIALFLILRSQQVLMSFRIPCPRKVKC